jgi:hypothetical protein
MVIDRSHDELRRSWGITAGYWLIPTPIRILFVIDGDIDLTTDVFSFGLGFVLDTLLAPFSFSVRFEVAVAKRDGNLDPGVHQLAFRNFKFTDPGFNLDSFDQVWFFGNNPSDATRVVTDNDIPFGFPLDDAELKLVAEWMDRGGGVFAAGDHSILGASMCSRIPRVRTMRKWTQAQHVPTKSDSARHSTLQPTAEPELVQEGDVVLQPVELVYRQATGPLPFLRPPVPHPLLCSGLGVIDRFPDHMHEGEVIADEDVQLDLPLDIPGYDRPEYPFAIPVVLASGPGDVDTMRPRPRPQVIAYGRTTNPFFEPPVVSGVLGGSTLPRDFKRFGLVGVYDGDSAEIGRVVVDSTWHHWFSLNLVGLAEKDSFAFQKMQAYYRNVGMWLARPSQRGSMLVSGVWGVLNGSAPMAFSSDMGPWQVGQRILATLGLTFSPCMLDVVIAPFLPKQVPGASSVPVDLPESDPSWLSLPDEVVNRAVVGGIGSALLDLALNDREKRARGHRTRLNGEAIRSRALDGASRGQALWKKAVEDAATSLTALHSTWASAVERPVDLRLPIKVHQLRIVAETLQFPDPSDPALLDRRVMLTIRIKLDGSVVAYQALQGVEIPALDERGSVIELRHDLGEVAVQTGESLSIEVLVGNWTSEKVNPEVIRFEDTLRGDIATWIGKRMPARSQAWRLWYTIEESREIPCTA